MTEPKVEKMSAVAIMENWKVAVSKEMAVAAQFEDNWGFLKAREEETKPRPFETRLVKYFEHGKATVKDKRIPLASEQHGGTPKTPDNEVFKEDPEKLLQATHTAQYRTTNSRYGARGGLELFGVADHGRSAAVTKHFRYL